MNFDIYWALPSHMAENILRSIYSEKEKTPSASYQGSSNASNSLCHVQNGVAIISIAGPISRVTQYSPWSGRRLTVGQDDIYSALQSAFNNTDVQSILISFNCPGGVVHGTKELADFMATSPKPIASYVDGLCASAAFWLASATGRIFSPQTSSVGSVGVICLHADFSRYYDKLGITFTPITAGTYKSVGSDSKPLSEEDHTYLKKDLENIHTIFKADVKQGLSLTAPESAWGEAQMFLAKEAQELGLVTDIVQDIHNAINTLAKEHSMDKETLAAQHPTLLAEVQKEAVAEFMAKAKQEQDAILAVVSACVGEEGMSSINATLDKCKTANLTAAQISALAPSLAVPLASSTQDKPEDSAESKERQAILAGLQSVSPEPLNAQGKTIPSTQQSKSSLVADAEQRAAKAKE